MKGRKAIPNHSIHVVGDAPAPIQYPAIHPRHLPLCHQMAGILNWAVKDQGDFPQPWPPSEKEFRSRDRSN